MDEDVKNMSLQQAQQEVMLLRAAIRQHMKLEGHDRCHLDDICLYSYLPEGPKGNFKLPPECEFFEQCKLFHKNRSGQILNREKLWYE